MTKLQIAMIDLFLEHFKKEGTDPNEVGKIFDTVIKMSDKEIKEFLRNSGMALCCKS